MVWKANRSVCLRDAAGRLAGIREYTKVARGEDGVLRDRPEGGPESVLTGDEPVSMNCWGFQPSFFGELERGFGEFLERVGTDNPKAEYTIPEVVDACIRSGRGTVEVLETASRWFGVTYREDKAAVQASIRDLVARGEYPAKL